MRTIHRDTQHSVPMRELVQLAADVDHDLGLTIDFEASHDFGQPMVVVRMPAARATPDWWPDLSPREREVAMLLARGLANKQIATQLSISVATVKDHVHHVLSKTGLSSRAAVAAAWPGTERLGS